MPEFNPLNQEVQVTIKDRPEEAPNYKDWDPVPSSLMIAEALVVCRGMESGAPTLDLQCVDREGNTYTLMVTNGIIQSLAAVMQGAYIRTTLEDDIQRRNPGHGN